MFSVRLSTQVFPLFHMAMNGYAQCGRLCHLRGVACDGWIPFYIKHVLEWVLKRTDFIRQLWEKRSCFSYVISKQAITKSMLLVGKITLMILSHCPNGMYNIYNNRDSHGFFLCFAMGINSFANFIYVSADPHLYMTLTPMPNRSVWAVADSGTCSVFFSTVYVIVLYILWAYILTEALTVDVYFSKGFAIGLSYFIIKYKISICDISPH